MKKLNLFSIAIFFGVLILLTSCFDEPGTSVLFEGSFVEIQEATTSSGLDVNKTYTQTIDGISLKDSLRVNLVGKQRNAPLNVSFAIDAASTAVADTHYKMITTGGTVTIPANSSYGYIKFEILDDNILKGQTWKLKFNLSTTDASDVKLNENYKSFTRGIRVN